MGSSPFIRTNKKRAERLFFCCADEGGERIPRTDLKAAALILREGGTAKVPPSHIPLFAVIPGGCRIGLIAADEGGERIPFYKGQAPALILREGGTAKVPPSHFPLLADRAGRRVGRGRAAGPAAKPPKRTGGSLARRYGGRPAARVPAPCRGLRGGAKSSLLFIAAASPA